MAKSPIPDRQAIEVRTFKWPRRPKGVTETRLLGEDEFGRWLGVVQGEPWWAADGSRSGVFETAVVKLVPGGTFWTACFRPDNPVVDVDIVLPPQWIGDVLEEIDLELDVVRSADGIVRVRDREEFERVRAVWAVPDDIVAQAEATCERLRELVELRAEPFGEVGRGWLSRLEVTIGGDK